MMPDDLPPPLSFEDFLAKVWLPVLDNPGDPRANYLRSLPPDTADLAARSVYLATLAKLQRPDMSPAEMTYSTCFMLARHFLDLGQTPESAREELARMPWDSLPGMSDYGRETANAIAVRALQDVLAGRPPTPLY